MAVGPGPAAANEQAVLLLAAPLGDGAPTLPPAAFARLLTRLTEHGIDGPGELLGLDAPAIADRLTAPPETAARLASLLARGATLGLALERLAGLGIHPLTRLGAAYPSRLHRLDTAAPPVLFVAGPDELLDAGGVAIVGSRDADAETLDWTAELAGAIARDGRTVVSGAARGVDSAAMRGALEAGGSAIGVLADSLARRIREPETRAAIADGRAVLVTPWAADGGFSTGAAMGRNKLIYALADAAIVVASADGSGGTWAGATEALAAGWVPVFVRADGRPGGNAALIGRGAVRLDWTPGQPLLELASHVTDGVPPALGSPSQVTLFDGEISIAGADRTAAKKRSRFASRA